MMIINIILVNLKFLIFIKIISSKNLHKELYKELLLV